MERGAPCLDRHARLHDRRRRTAGSRGGQDPLKKLRKPLRFGPLGDAAAYAEFSETLDLEVNEALQVVAAALRARQVPWIRDVVPALTGIALHFDPEHAGLPAAPLAAAAELLEQCLKSAESADDSGRLVEIPVCYEPAFALDIVEVAEKTGIAPEDIAQRHAASEHHVLMVGFAPGQPYIGGLDAALAVPRRGTPRTRLPAGSVAIANAQTAVYPFEISGGWSVIGRTPLELFDPARDPPSLFAPGDRVRFVPVTRAEFERLR
ncbi:MAG: 5-oxoprolinase subunit PxpB [Burkholderiales bacterium]